jgi:hypothetical protein
MIIMSEGVDGIVPSPSDEPFLTLAINRVTQIPGEILFLWNLFAAY